MVKRQANGDKKKVNKKALFLKLHDIKRPPTGFQLWKASVKDTLKADIAEGKAPADRAAAFEMSLTGKGRYDLTRYSGLLWRSEEQGGTGYVSDAERAKWDAKYDEAKAQWQAQRDKVLEEFPSRPPSAYLLFYTQDFQEQYQAKWKPDPKAPKKTKPTMAEIAKAASVVWTEKKNSDEFKKYHEQAAALKEAHEAKKQRFEAKYGEQMRELMMGENEPANDDEQQEEQVVEPPTKRARKTAAATKKVTAKQAAARADVVDMEQDDQDAIGANVSKAKRAAAPKKARSAAPKRKRVVAEQYAAVGGDDEQD